MKSMKSIKKGLLNVCNKLKQQQQDSNKSNNQNEFSKKDLDCESRTCTSSGYGSSVSSASSTTSFMNEKANSVYFNLDNYFYDENFAHMKSKAHESTLLMKENVVKCLLKYQTDFVATLRNGIEMNVRPLSAFMKPQVFYKIFQNIEKIYSVSEFVRNSINDSVTSLHTDVYNSTLNVFYENIHLIHSTYELYLRGYERAIDCLNETINDELVNETYSDYNLFDLVELPTLNISKLYDAFTSLLDMTSSSDVHDYERLQKIVGLLGQLCENETNVTENVSESNYNNIKSTFSTTAKSSVLSYNSQHKLPSDFTDNDGIKYYFL